MLQLLGVRGNGLVPAARAGVAGWLLDLDPRLSAHLVGENAVLLLQSGIEVSCDQVRADLVDALFLHVADRALAAPWELDLALVDHPGLAEQLAGRLDARTVSDTTLWCAAASSRP
jgi:hypothetical protein